MANLVLRGTLVGHNGWVTSLATNADNPEILISGSRDKTIISWNLESDAASESAGVPKRSLHGHSHYIEDVVLSSDGAFALSCSWDRTLRLWDLNTGSTTKTFVGHGKDVLSVAFSADNRQIVSGGRDKSLKLWNTLGQCKCTIGQTESKDAHSEWVSCVRFSPNIANPLVISAGWDKNVKVWNLKDFQLKYNLTGHTGYVNAVAISPDGSLCASGGKDGAANLWDLNEGKLLYSLQAGSVINALEFSPNRYWLVVATNNGIKIWDLENKNLIEDLHDFPFSASYGKKKPSCISLAWSGNGGTLYAGYTDGVIRVWEVRT